MCFLIKSYEFSQILVMLQLLKARPTADIYNVTDKTGQTADVGNATRATSMQMLIMLQLKQGPLQMFVMLQLRHTGPTCGDSGFA